MKNSKDIMHVREYKSKKGELSFQLYYSGTDRLTGESKLRVKTYKVPAEIKGVKALDEFRMKCQLEWKEECQKIARGIVVTPVEDMGFYKYACMWVENLLIYNPEGYNHYSACKHNLQVFKEKLGMYMLTEMTLPVIQGFCKWLVTRTYRKEKITVIRSLEDIVKGLKKSLREISEGVGISHCTLVEALKIGATVNMLTATRLCDYFKVSMDKYFKVESVNVVYSKSANRGLKVQLHSILKQAVIDGYIAVNYASRDYTHAITGTEGEKEILDDMGDIKEFILCVDKEQDIRKRVAFSIFINLGLRCTEVAGLEWKDFDFGTNELSINRNTLYVPGFGIVTKSPKSKKSKRVISVPASLMDLMKEYKAYWALEKIGHGDLWEHTDRLFCQYNGKDMAGSTIAGWLSDFQVKNNLKRVTPHGLRHTNITMLISNGVDVKTVSARVGHADVQTTLNVYTHYTSEADRQAANITDKLLKIG